MNLKALVVSLRRDADELEQLDRMLTGLGGRTTVRKSGGGRRKLSKEARARIAAAQKARWAKVRAAKK